MTIEIPIHAEEGVVAPAYASQGAAGADVRAHLSQAIVVKPGGFAAIPTGLRCEIPDGYEIQVRPRSGLAYNAQVTVLNSPGTIDSDYRGEIKVMLINLGEKDFVVEPGMRVAQLVVCPVLQARFVPCGELTATERGSGGFGHTGLH